MSQRRIQLLEQQLRHYAADNERLRRGIDNALPLLRAGDLNGGISDLVKARKRGENA